MRVPLRWLGEFIDLPGDEIDEIVYALDMLGHTVDGVERLEAGWSEVYVGKVLDITAHPDADKVRVCQVDSGEGSTQIICGAWNFETGASVAVARPGAVLPGGLEIGERTIRGVESHGMICSERELGLGSDHAGILVLDDDPEIGVPFADLVELPDVVLDLEITTNRPDALSLRGVARDLAAWFGGSHRVPPVALATVEGATTVGVEIADPTGCRRFTAREIRGVSVGKAPLQMRHRLHKAGIRSISNVVDVTNYVMLELGHPLHAFDAGSIVGDRLVVRRAKQGETLITLDDVERELSPDDLVIYDEDGPTSMSGTMGGARSEVIDSTSRVLMEAASWDPATIQGMWRRHDLRSEAATRFERGVDPNLADVANQRASAMVAALTGGKVLEGAVDVIAVPTEPVEIEFSVAYVERLLGPGFTSARVKEILESLDMVVDGDEPMTVTVPTFRPDVTRPADLVEEVARIHGYDKFESTLPTGPAGSLTPEQTRQRELMRALVGVGLTQAMSLPFVGSEDLDALGRDTEESSLLTVANPLHDEESKLRPTLLPGLLRALRYNQSHGISSAAMFEIGKVFHPVPDEDDPRLPLQHDRLAWVVTGDVGLEILGVGARAADADFSLGLWRHLARELDIEAELRQASIPGLHPGRTAEIVVAGETVGHVGELTPSAAAAFDIQGRVAVAEIELAPLIAPVPPVQVIVPSTFPPVDFDLSFLIDLDAPAMALLTASTEAAGGLVENARVFDEFKGESLPAGKRAIAIRYRLRAPDRTLETAEITSIRQAMIEAGEAVGAALRGG